MIDEGFHRRPRNKPTYLMVPRKLMITWIASFICMVIMTSASIQWAYYIDKRSNQRWCGLVVLFNDAYRVNPPSTSLGKKIALEMLQLQTEFSCKKT